MVSSHFCPVCWRDAQQTMNGNIYAHFDGASNECPGGNQPFTIAITAPSRITLRHIIKDIHEMREAIAA
ncbi:hypothetical protein, partial [Mycobacteroides abscessus]|uniref:hypothetical protein n=1 Tax=Mycobacteroides abscessus TaxID=36809 RepID=UPI000516ECDB